MTAKDAIEYLVDQRASGLAPEVFSDLIDRLLWMQADNGTQLMAAMNDWIEGDDHYRIKIALGLEEPWRSDLPRSRSDGRMWRLAVRKSWRHGTEPSGQKLPERLRCGGRIFFGRLRRRREFDTLVEFGEQDRDL